MLWNDVLQNLRTLYTHTLSHTDTPTHTHYGHGQWTLDMVDGCLTAVDRNVQTHAIAPKVETIHLCQSHKSFERIKTVLRQARCSFLYLMTHHDKSIFQK